jgi:hypothetical protein
MPSVCKNNTTHLRRTSAVDETFYDAINYIPLFCIDKQKIKQGYKQSFSVTKNAQHTGAQATPATEFFQF